MATKAAILRAAKAAGVRKARSGMMGNATRRGLQQLYQDVSAVGKQWRSQKPDDAAVSTAVRRWQAAWRALTTADPVLHSSDVAPLMSLGNTRGDSWSFAFRLAAEIHALGIE